MLGAPVVMLLPPPHPKVRLEISSQDQVGWGISQTAGAAGAVLSPEGQHEGQPPTQRQHGELSEELGPIGGADPHLSSSKMAQSQCHWD